MSDATPRSSVSDRVLAILARELPLVGSAGLAPDTPLLSAGLLDSFGIVTLLAALEDAFGVSFDVEQMALEQFETPATIAAACESALRSRAVSRDG